MKKVLFLHGFYASGSCPLAIALREGLEGVAGLIKLSIPLPDEYPTFNRDKK